MTEKHESLAEAMAAFQADLPAVTKGSTASIPGRPQYRYADLADLSAAVLPALGRHGLSWMAMPTLTESGTFVLRYELLHTSGQSRTGEYTLPQGTPQQIGSALTYARRQCLSAVTGVAADEDDDGAAAQHATPARNGSQPAKPPAVSKSAKEALEELDELCDAMGYDISRVEKLWSEENKGSNIRRAATVEHARLVRAFTAKLDEVDPTRIKSPAANGASS